MRNTFHVSPTGNDAWAGTEARPFATLARACDAARGAVARILVHDGEYFDVSLVLGPQYAGLTIMAAPGEIPILYGGRRVTGWRQEGAFYVADMPGVREGAWDFRLLAVNGQVRPRARMPETGRFEHESVFDVRWMSSSAGGWERKPTEEELTTMRYKTGDIGPWLDVNNAEVTVYHQWDESMVGLRAIDEKTRTLIFSSPTGHPPGAFEKNTYVVWNVREGLREPGQWRLDRTKGTVVYWPLPGETPETLDVIAPTTESIIRLAGKEDVPVSHVTLRGLTLAVTTTPLVSGGFGAYRYAGAVDGAYTSNCRVEDVTIRNVAGQGIKLMYSDSACIMGCEITATGACGVICRGNEAAITENLVSEVGIVYPSAIGISASGQDVTISHNEVNRTSYTGISSGGAGNRIAFNLITDVMQVLNDGGGIYITFCKDFLLRGNVIRGSGAGNQAHAIYLDEQAQNCLVEGNLAIDTRSPLHGHMAWHNTYRENICIDQGDAVYGFPRCEGLIIERNVFVAGGRLLLRTPPGGIGALRENVLHSAAGHIDLEDMQDYTTSSIAPLTPAEGTVIANPQFTGPVEGDYTFHPGSPAAELGIPPIDVRMAGRNKST